MRTATLTEQFANHICGWRKQGIPTDALDAARFYLLDWVGSTLAGGATKPGGMLLDYARAQPAGPSRIPGTDLALAADTAALINGGLSHIVEMDDLDRGSVVHPAAAVIPAALAIAERTQARADDFLSAIVAGYEVAIRLGEAVGKRHYFYFHNTATCGIFGAAVAAGWLLDLNQEELVWALGNAGTQAAGLWQFNANGDMSKHLHAGRSGAGGVLAADLAALGFTGARQILEGERGFFAATAPDSAPDRLLIGLESATPVFKIYGVSIKPHASCRHTHPAIDACLALRTQMHELGMKDLSQIESVEIDTYQATLDLCDNPDPQSTYAAKFSLYFCAASALVRGHAALSAFEGDALMDADVRLLLARIRAAAHPEIESRYPQAWPAEVRLRFADGTVLSQSISHPKGDPENQLSLDELTDKFRVLATYGGQAESADRWLKWIDELTGDTRVMVMT